MGSISLQNVSKLFGEAKVIPSIDLDINDGEFVVFVGPSGCGKSTLLRLIAGLITRGDVTVTHCCAEHMEVVLPELIRAGAQIVVGTPGRILI